MIPESLSILPFWLLATHLGRPPNYLHISQLHRALLYSPILAPSGSRSQQATSRTWTTNWLFPRLHLTKKSVPCLMVAMTLDVWLVRS